MLAIQAMFDFLRRWKKRPVQDAWHASAYLYDSQLIIHSSNRTYNNVGWNSEPVFTTIASDSAEQLGSFVRAALSASQWDAAIPDPVDETSPVLKACGARSNEFERRSRLVLIELKDDEICFYPMRPHTRKEGKGWGFVVLEGAEIRFPSNAGVEELGAALLEAIDKSVPMKSNR